MSESRSIRVHALRCHKDHLKTKYVQVVYFPKETYLFLEKLKDRFQYITSFNDIRTLLNWEYYNEIILVNFSDQALRGEEPWIYLSEEGYRTIGLDIHQSFLRWLKDVLESKELSLPIELNDCEVLESNLSVFNFFHFGSRNSILSALLLYDFVKSPKQLKHDYVINPLEGGAEGKKKRVLSESYILFPEKWYFKVNGLETEAVSDICSNQDFLNRARKIGITDREREILSNQFFMYVLSVKIKAGDTPDDVIVEIRSSTHLPVHAPLYVKGEFKMSDKEKRSLYIVNENFSNKMIHLSMTHLKNRNAVFIGYKSTEAFKRIGFTPYPRGILSKPSDYYVSYPIRAFIPYVPEDKNRNSNRMERGVSRIEKKALFDMFHGVHSYLPLAYNTEEIKIGSMSLIGNKSYLGSGRTMLNEEMHVHIISYDDQILDIIEKVLLEWNLDPDTKISNSLMEVVRYDVKKISKLEYELLDRHNNACALTIYFHIRPDLIHLTEAMNYSMDDKNATREMNTKIRIQDIINQVPAEANIQYVLAQIDKYSDYDKEDPYQAIHKGFNEVNHIVQCFHPLESSQKSIIKSALADLFVRKGLTNQMLHKNSQLFSKKTYYFPRCVKIKVNNNEGFLYILAKMENGIISIKYLESEWMDIAQSLTYLKKSNIRKSLRESNIQFTHFIEAHAKTLDDVVVFEKIKLQDKSLEKYNNPSKLDFILVVYDNDSNRTPYIEVNDSNGVVSNGAVTIKTDGKYMLVPPKLNTSQLNMNLTKKESNQFYSFRNTTEMQLNIEDNEVVAAVHLMKGIALTYDSYLNDPLPLHVMKHHLKLLDVKK
jgi:hypothetical protein